MTDNPLEIRPVIKINLTNEQVIDITDKALQADWVCLRNVPESESTRTTATRIVNNDADIIFDDVDENQSYLITRNKILLGITRWLEQGATARIGQHKLNTDKITDKDAARILHLGVDRIRWSRYSKPD